MQKLFYSFRNKLPMAVFIGIMVVLLGFYNIEERQSLNQLQRSFTTVFEDRLMAESYIFELSDHLYRKQLLLEKYRIRNNSTPPAPDLIMHNSRIGELIADFEKTRLTEKEAAVFQQFRKTMKDLEISENRYLAGKSDARLETMEQHHELAGTLLTRLSEIQVEVGKNVNKTGNKLMLGWMGSSKFEMAILLIFCLIMQAMIFTSGSAMPRIPQKADWN